MTRGAPTRGRKLFDVVIDLDQGRAYYFEKARAAARRFADELEATGTRASLVIDLPIREEALRYG